MNELLLEANKLRKEKGYCTIIEFGEIKVVVDPDKAVTYQEGKSYKIKDKAIKEQSMKILEDISKIEPLIQTVMSIPDKETTDSDNLKLVDRLSRLLLIQGAYYEDKVFNINGWTFKNKHELLSGLPYIYNSKPKMSFDDISRKAMYADYMRDQDAMLIDGVAVVASSQHAFNALDKTKFTNIACIGYLDGESIKWGIINESEYRTARTNNGEIKILRYLYEEGITSVMRFPTMMEKSKAHESLYPVAILEDGEYAHYFER